MKKLVLLFLLFGCVSSIHAQDLIFNCRTETNKEVKVVDTIKRKIKQVENKIVFESYKDGKDLVLNIDSIVKNTKALGLKKDKDWYYCTDEYDFKYIVIGLGSSYVSLYQIFSDVDIFEEVFTSLK